MKIVRSVHQLFDLQLPESASHYVRDSTIPLEPPLDHDEARVFHDIVVALDDLWRDYHVDETPLVFEQDEDGALCTARPLTHGYETGDHDALSITQILHVTTCNDTSLAETLAHVLHGMTCHAYPRSLIIQEYQLPLVELPGIVAKTMRGCQREVVANRTQRLPCCTPAIRLSRTKSSSARKLQRLGACERDTLDDVGDGSKW